MLLFRPILFNLNRLYPCFVIQTTSYKIRTFPPTFNKVIISLVTHEHCYSFTFIVGYGTLMGNRRYAGTSVVQTGVLR